MNNRTHPAVKIAAFVLMIFAVIAIINLTMKFNKLKDKRDGLLSELAVEKLQLEELVEEYGHEIDEDYVKKIAREELGYHYPDEIIYYNDLNK